MRIVRTKSIPNVPDDRLTIDQARIHTMIHTPEGIAAWDQTRRGMIDQGRKGKAIAAEMRRRGMVAADCTFCQPNPERNQ
jgi:hypothetical protein